MSWLVDGAISRDDLLALHPQLAADHQRVIDEMWTGSVDPRILELCRLRTATVLGNRLAWTERTPVAVEAGLDESTVGALADWPSDDRFDSATRACLALSEQIVIDVHGVTDDQMSDVEAAIGADGVIVLTTALAMWEITHRLDNALLGGSTAEPDLREVP